MPMSPEVQQLLSLLLEQTKEHAVILISAEGTITHWLGAARRIMGYAAEEVVGLPVSMIFTNEDRDNGVPEHELAVARAHGRSEDDRWHLRKDGATFWASGAVTALYRPDGPLAGYAKVFRDRTDIRAHAVVLENRLDALERLLEQRNSFLASVSHELRNPMGTMLNAVRLIERGAGKPEEMAGPLGILDRQLGVLKRITDDLLATSGAAVGRLTLQRRPTDVCDLLRRIVEGFGGQARERRQQVHLLIPKAPIVVSVDPERLEQAIVNLVLNAMKYTPVGGNIWVKASTEAGALAIRVEDDGIGIAAEMLPRIFDMFTREPSVDDDAPPGMGIGLALVKKIATLHGGSAEVRSEGRDRGSEFTVRLPVSSPDR